MRSYRFNFTAILIAETLAIAGFALSMPVIPFYLEDLGIRNEDNLKFWTGLIQSASAVSLAVFAPIWGALADTHGRRIMLQRAMFGGAIVLALMSLCNAPWQLLLLRVLQGCLTGTVAAATVLVAGIAPAAQVGVALGLLQAGISTGNSVGPLIGGVVSDFLGHRAAFIATGIILLTAGVIITFFVEDDWRPTLKVRGRKTRLLPDFTYLVSKPSLLSLLLVVFALQAANSIITPILPLFIRHINPDVTLVGSSTGIVLGAGAAAAALAAALVGGVSRKLGYRKTLVLCLSGAVFFVSLQTFVTSTLQLTLLRVCELFFLGGAMPSVNALIAGNSDRDKQGGIYGLSSSVSSTGAALGPLLGSTAAALFDYRAVFPVAAVMLLITLLTVRNASRKSQVFQDSH